MLWKNIVAGLSPDVLRQIRNAIRSRGVNVNTITESSSSSSSSSASSSSSMSQLIDLSSARRAARPRTRQELISAIRRRIDANQGVGGAGTHSHSYFVSLYLTSIGTVACISHLSRDKTDGDGFRVKRVNLLTRKQKIYDVRPNHWTP